jgi:endoglucanase
VSHPYPQKTGEPLEKNWEEAFGFIAQKYPLFATEIGYMRSDEPGAHIPVENDDGTYGKRITDYLHKKGASWTAWCFHPQWSPQLVSDWDFTPTESGKHFRSVMQKQKTSSK